MAEDVGGGEEGGGEAAESTGGPGSKVETHVAPAGVPAKFFDVTNGNIDHENVSIGKAGRNHWLGKRPHVRGVAMNPVGHPHGGGEGKASGGRHPVSPWGQSAKGYRTRRRKQTDSFIVQRRRQK